jgi:hypothetical protein
MVILVSEDSNRYAHLFLIEREYFGFNTPESIRVNITCVSTLILLYMLIANIIDNRLYKQF